MHNEVNEGDFIVVNEEAHKEDPLLSQRLLTEQDKQNFTVMLYNIPQNIARDEVKL